MQAATRNTLSFILDGQRIDLNTISPSTTVLNFLREQLNRTGTKEGCAEGDCGACTVVIVDLQQGKLRYRAVNACIQFLPVLDGKCLYTVESLKAQQGLHPVQQAMVDCHASQCGFCTPGFVMSLFAVYKTEDQPSRERLCTALSGNLCRCTGYRPILEAGQRMYEYAAQLPSEQQTAVSAPFGNQQGQAELIAQLESLKSM
ncbi:MAG TPA: 2Fe-2S iron-sulfur cluster-binding protein, partial [Thiolinea sp.]|nr:2Fe-2S iron-sulfur cluster-binding protein [Thiolinea sp.]